MPSAALDPSLYPRKYLLTPAAKGFYFFLGAALVSLGFFIAGDILVPLLGHQHRIIDYLSTVLLIASSIFLFVSGIYAILIGIKLNITLYKDAIEIQNPVFFRIFQRDQIAGCCLLPRFQSKLKALQLTLHGTRQRKYRVALLFSADSAFYDWVNTFPDLDLEESKSAPPQIVTTPRDGDAPDILTIYPYRSGFVNVLYVFSIISAIVLGGLVYWAWPLFDQQPIYPLFIFSMLFAMPIGMALMTYSQYYPIGISERGVSKYRHGHQKEFIAWKDVQRIEKIRMYDSFYNRSVNQFFIRSATNCIQFSEWIYHYPNLIDRINRYIADHKIPAFFDDPGRISLWTIPLLRSNRANQQTKGEKYTGIQVEKL